MMSKTLKLTITKREIERERQRESVVFNVLFYMPVQVKVSNDQY